MRVHGAPRRRGGLPLIIAGIVVTVLCVAGSATAAGLIGSGQVKDGSLTGVDLARGTIRSSDVRNGSLMPSDFGVLPKGPQGPTGRDGDAGPPGDPGVAFREEPVTVGPMSTTPHLLLCSAPRIAVFGGASLPAGVDLRQSAPDDEGGGVSGWFFVIRNRNSDPAGTQITLQVFCVTAR